MHLQRARIYSLIGVFLRAISINPIITNSRGALANNIDNNNNAPREIGAEYFNICVEISPPFVLHAQQGADIKLINVIVTRLAGPAAARVLVLAAEADIVAEVQRCDIVVPHVWDNATTAAVGGALLESDFYHVDSMLLCAAKTRNQDDWKKLRTITTTQVSMVVPFVLYLAVTYYIGGKLIHPDRFQNLDIMLWSYFRVLCSVPNDEHHQPQQRALRFLYIAWLIFCFILTINYNTLILRVFKKELYSAQILSIEQAELDHVDLYTLSAFRGSMNYPRVFDCKTVPECLDLLKATEQLALPRPRDPQQQPAPTKKAKRVRRRQLHADSKLMIALPATIVDYNRRHFMMHGEATIHCFEHASAVYKRRIFVRRTPNTTGTWDMATLNKLLIHIDRSGVYTYWLRELTKADLQLQRNFHLGTNPLPAGNQSRHQANTTLDGNALTRLVSSLVRNPFADNPSGGSRPGNPIGMLVYKDFIVLYAYLLIGVVVSTLGFIAEHAYYYYKHRKCYSFAG